MDTAKDAGMKVCSNGAGVHDQDGRHAHILKISRTRRLMTWDLVCSIRVVGPTRPTKRQGQICFLMHLNGKISEKLIFLKNWKP